MGARIEGHDRAGPFPGTARHTGDPYAGGPYPSDPYFADASHASNGDGVELRTLLSRLGQDASQLAHDEMELVKIEARDIAEAFSRDMKEASRTVVKDLAKVGIALSLAFLAGLALTAGAVLAVGALLGGAYWAGGLIVGAVLLIAAAISAASAGKDLRESDALKMQHGRDTLQRDREVLRDEAQDTQAFAKQGARDFKEAASPGGDRARNPDNIPRA